MKRHQIAIWIMTLAAIALVTIGLCRFFTIGERPLPRWYRFPSIPPWVQVDHAEKMEEFRHGYGPFWKAMQEWEAKQ